MCWPGATGIGSSSVIKLIVSIVTGGIGLDSLRDKRISRLQIEIQSNKAAQFPWLGDEHEWNISITAHRNTRFSYSQRKSEHLDDPRSFTTFHNITI